MVHVAFTPNLARHVSCPATEVAGGTVREVLDVVFAANPLLRGYVLDDQGTLRRHMSVFVDGMQVRDRGGLSDPVPPEGKVFVAQALSGG
jgi:sulfur-carrier protein